MVAVEKKSLTALTSLRFFAAMAIVVHHCNGVFWPAAELGPLDVGVSFFFVLSGFILTYVYHDMHVAWKSLRTFYLARLARIWPLHLICLLLTMAFIMVPEPFDPAVLAANVLLLHAWVPFDRYFFSYNYVSWSLSAELFFYLAFPFLIINAQRWLYRTLLLVLVVVAVLALASYWAHLPDWDTTHDHLSATGLLYTNPLARFSEFLIGVATGAFFLRRKRDQAAGSFRWTVVEIVCIAVLLLAYRYFLSGLASLIHEMIWSAGATSVPLARLADEPAALAKASPFAGFVIAEWASHVALTPLAAIVIYVFAHQRGKISHALSRRWLAFLGEVSFALYLVHQIVLRFFQQHAMSTNWFGFGAFLVAITLIAVALHLLFEKPARRWLTGRL